jgi:hypothetical protein
MSYSETRARILENDWYQTRTARFLSDFQYNGQAVSSYFGEFQDYDYVLPNGETAELKRDNNAAITQNVAVEISRKAKGKQIPSGLSVSKADYYYFLIPNPDHKLYLYSIETERIKRLKPRLKKVECNGGRTVCHLLPMNELSFIGYYTDSFLGIG